MLVAVRVEGLNSGEWRDRLQEALPEIACQVLDGTLPADRVSHAAVWMPPRGWLATLPRLRCVVSLAAGVDHILEDPTVPADVPVFRLGGEPLAARMREYVLLAVLALHRDLPDILADCRNRVWRSAVPCTAAERSVGVMGLGALGRATLRKRSPPQGSESRAGHDGAVAFRASGALPAMANSPNSFAEQGSWSTCCP